MSKPINITAEKATRLDILEELESLKNSMGLSKHRFYKNHPFKPSKIEINKNEAYYNTRENLEKIYQKKAIIRSNRITSYISPLVRTTKPNINRNSLVNLAINKSNGYISKATQSKVSKMLETWYNIIEERRSRKKHRFEKIGFYITFVTLTLSAKQMHDDNEIKRSILVPYIQHLVRIHGVKNYYWKAEPQKNGNIHFHLLIDKFIDKKEINNSWNVAQNKLEYVDRYYEKYGDINPASTRIESIREKKNGIGYLIKYSTKTSRYLKKGEVYKGTKITEEGLYDYIEDDDKRVQVFKSRAIQGRCWGCSDILRLLEPLQIQLSYSLENLMEYMEQKGRVKLFEKDYVKVWSGKIISIVKENLKELFYQLKDYHWKLYSIIYKERQQGIFNKWQAMAEWWEDLTAVPIPRAQPVQIDIEF
jgi:hypothetical protein